MDLLTLPAEYKEHDETSLPTVMLRISRRGKPGQRRFPLNASKCSIGSSSRCQIRLPVTDAKPLQCLVAMEGNVAAVTRWAAGVTLNGRDFSKATLATGDRLMVGPWTIEFEYLAAPPQAPAEPAAATPTLNSIEAPESREDSARADAVPLDCVEQAFASRITELDPAWAGRNPVASGRTADAASKRLSAACQTFADRLVLELWTASRHARRRAKALIAAVRAARFQTTAALADLAAMEAELDLARAAYDTQANFREELEAAVAKQRQIADERVAELAEELASVRLALSQSQGALADRADECERLNAALAVTTEQCEALRSSDAYDGERIGALEASLREQADRYESLSSRMEATQAELTEAIAQLRQRTDQWQATAAELDACRHERDHLAQSAQHSELQSRLAEAEDRLAQQAAARIGEQTSTQELNEQLAAAAEEVERLAASLAAAEAAKEEAELAQQNQSELFASQLAEIQRLELDRADELRAAVAERDELARQLSLRAEAAPAEWSSWPAQPDDAAAGEEGEAPNVIDAGSAPTANTSLWRGGFSAAGDDADEPEVAAPTEATEFDGSHFSDEGRGASSDTEAAWPDAPSEAPSEVVESSWKIEPSAVEQPPAAFESTSFIEKYRHLLDDECDATPPPTANRMGALLDDEFLSPAKALTGPPDDSDEALEAYMASMMQRMRGDASPPLPRAQGGQERAERATSAMPAFLADPEPAADEAAPLLGPAEFEAMKLATRKAPLASDLAALREIANNSARTAIATHHQRRHFESAVGKLTIAGTATFTSAYMMSSAPAMSDWMFWAGGVMAGIGIIAALQVLQIERRRSASRKVLAAGRQAALEATPLTDVAETPEAQGAESSEA